MVEEPETTTTVKEKHSINWGAIILWPIVILLLYVLSLGPVMMMMEKGHISARNVLFRFYEPLRWAYEDTPLRKPLGMYLHIWAPHYFDKNGNNLYSPWVWLSNS